MELNTQDVIQRSHEEIEKLREARRHLVNLHIGRRVFQDWLYDQLGSEALIQGLHIDYDTAALIITIQHPKFEVVPDGGYIPRVLPAKDIVDGKLALSLEI
jgi:hypothetical protein